MYHHHKKIIMGTDIISKKNIISKFITIDLDDLENESSHPRVLEFFNSN